MQGTDILASPGKRPVNHLEFVLPEHLGDFAIRALLVDGEPWFVAADIASVLGYRDAANAVRLLDIDERGTQPVSTPGGMQAMTVINESGFYRLVLRSNQQGAKQFQRWVTGEVLPTIRKTGRYGAVPEVPRTLPEALRAYAAEVEAREAAEEIAARQRIELAERGRIMGELSAQKRDLEPKAEAFEQLMDADGTYSLAQAAQALGMGRNELIELLSRYSMLIVRKGHSDHLRPYEAARRDGRMALKVRTFEQEHRDGRKTMETDTTARVTPKGLEYVRARRLRGQQHAVTAA